MLQPPERFDDHKLAIINIGLSNTGRSCHHSSVPTSVKRAATSSSRLERKIDRSWSKAVHSDTPPLRLSSSRAKVVRATRSAPTICRSPSTAKSKAGPLSSDGTAAIVHTLRNTREVSVFPLHARQLLSQLKPMCAAGSTSSTKCPAPTLAAGGAPHSLGRCGAFESVGHDGREPAVVQQYTCRSHLCLRLLPTKLLRPRCPGF